MDRSVKIHAPSDALPWPVFRKSQVIKYSAKVSHKHCHRWEPLNYPLHLPSNTGHHPWSPAGTAQTSDAVGLPLPTLVMAVGGNSLTR